MSKYDKEREGLGIHLRDSSSSTKTTKTQSKYDAERQSYVDTDKKQKENKVNYEAYRNTTIDTTNLKVQPRPPASVQPGYLKPKASIGSFSALQQFQKNAPKPQSKQDFYDTEAAARSKQLTGAPGIIKKPLEKVGHVLDVVQANIPYLADFQKGAGAFQGVNAETAPVTGGTGGKIAKFAGQLAGGVVNPAALEQSAVTGAGRVTTGALQRLGGNLGEAPTFAQRLAGNAAEGAMQGAANTAASGRTSLKDVAAGAAFGGAGGAAFEALGTGIGKGVSALRKISNAPELPTRTNPLGIAAGQKKPGPYENLKSDTKSQLVSRSTKETPTIKQKLNQVYSDWWDDLNRINQTDKIAAKAQGLKELPKSKSAYANALASRYSDQIAKQMISDAQINSSGDIIGESLKDALGGIKRQNMVDFEDYLVNRHAITRAGRGEKVFDDSLQWTPEKGAEKVQAYEQKHPEFADAAEKLRKYQDNMAQSWGVDEGLLEQGALDHWRDNNSTYVPNKRYFSELEKGGGGQSRISKGYVGQNSTIKEANKFGSQRKIISPIESIIENTEGIVKAAKRNKVGQLLYQQVADNPDAFKGIAEIVQHEPKQKPEVPGNEPTDIMDDLADTAETFSKPKLDRNNVVRVMMNGKPAYLKINEKPLLDTLQAVGPENSVAVMDFLGKITGVFKNLTTGSNPVFSLTRNIVRDIPEAYKNSKTTNNPLKFIGDLLHSAYSIMGKTELYKEYKRIGGGHASPIAVDRNLLAQSKAKVLPHQNRVKGGLIKGYGAYQDFLNAVETAPRLAEYKRSAQKGDKAKGLFESQDVTVNFKRHGKYGRQIDKVVPYFNASMQAMDKFVRSYKDNPGKAITKSIVSTTLPTVILYAINHDDPNYQKVSKNVKDNFFLIPKGDGTFLKFAKSKETATLFSDLPERLMDLFYAHDPSAFDNFATQIRTTFTPPMVSGMLQKGGIPDRISGAMGDTIMGPFADIAANKNFVGSPIVPGYLQNVSPSLQADARTSALSKEVGRLTAGTAIETSPKKLDYAFKQYLGVIGQLGIPAMTPGAGDNPLQAIGQSLKSQMTADPVFSNDIIDNFYTVKTKYDTANADADITNKYPAWYSDDIRKHLGKVSRDMSKVRTEMRSVEDDKTLLAEEKRVKLREMQEKMNQIAQSGLDLLPNGGR